MPDSLVIAKTQLLTPSGLDERSLQHVMDSMLNKNIDMAELYFQNIQSESWLLEEGIVKSSNFNADKGVGVRSVSGDKTGFAYANDIQLEALTSAANAVKSIASTGKNHQLQVWKRSQPLSLYRQDNPLFSLTPDAKVALLKQADAYTRSLDERVQKVTISLSGSHETILVADSNGTFAADVRPLIHFNIAVIVEENGRRESGRFGGGRRDDYSFLLHDQLWKEQAREAVRIAIVNLQAEPAPAGTMPVIMGSGWNGVLLHEAVGHGLEGDFNRKGSSSYSGKVGEKVASGLCTIVDDGTLVGRRGSLNIDDEGVVSGCNVLVENGILKGYMQDKMNAKLMKVSPTGNGRRESYAHIPMPRMTNTYMLPGKHTQAEIIESVDRGIYVANMGGGQVDITSGKFVFSASEAYLVEKGKITKPLKGATLIGSGPDAMSRVSMVGNDLSLDPGIGICGKAGQSVPVGVGQPTIKIDELTVGGTSI